MKQWFSFAALLVLLIGSSCRTVQPLIQFGAFPSHALQGDTVTLHWQVTDADSVKLEGERVSWVGRKRVVIPQHASRFVWYELVAYKGGVAYPERVMIIVSPRPRTVPRGTPAKEQRSTQPSQYLRGIVNAQNVKPQDQPKLEIVLVEAQDFADSVILYCTVRDKYGNYIANLAPPYNDSLRPFWKAVIEYVEGEEHPISDFSVREIRQNGAPPFTTAFVLDYSGSMADDIQFVEQALQTAMRYLRYGKDDFTIIQFDHRIQQPVAITGDPDALYLMIPFALLGGGTAYIDAACAGLTALEQSQKRKVLVVFTDGFDNASFWCNPWSMVLQARRLNAKVFIIGFERPWGAPQRKLLDLVALLTGGKAYFPRTLAELDAIFREIYMMMQVYYRIAYPKVQAGKPLRLAKMRLEFPGLGQLLEAERTYYTTPDPEFKTEIAQEFWHADRAIVVARFEHNRAQIRAQDTVRLNELAAFLRQHPDLKVRIVGHTDTSGDPKFNKKLSLRRAQIVAHFLQKRGVPKRQIAEVIGMGEEAPLYPEEANEVERQENRRVEVQFVQ